MSETEKRYVIANGIERSVYRVYTNAQRHAVLDAWHEMGGLRVGTTEPIPSFVPLHESASAREVVAEVSE